MFEQNTPESKFTKYVSLRKELQLAAFFLFCIFYFL